MGTSYLLRHSYLLLLFGLKPLAFFCLFWSLFYFYNVVNAVFSSLIIPDLRQQLQSAITKSLENLMRAKIYYDGWEFRWEKWLVRIRLGRSVGNSVRKLDKIDSSDHRPLNFLPRRGNNSPVIEQKVPLNMVAPPTWAIGPIMKEHLFSQPINTRRVRET